MSIRDDVAAAARYIEWREETGYAGSLADGLDAWQFALQKEYLRALIASDAPAEVRLAALEQILDES